MASPCKCIVPWLGINISNTKVELFNVALKGCDNAALYIPPSTSATTVVATHCEFANSWIGAFVHGSLTSATFNNCVFHDNSGEGIFVASNATIHLHGEATAIHSNVNTGIYANGSSKVLIHLPSHHNTIYNNTGHDRFTFGGGTITNVDEEADN